MRNKSTQQAISLHPIPHYRSRELLAADTEDIEIDDDRFMSFCIKFKYLGTFFVPSLSATADITKRISQARKLFNSINRQVLGDKHISMDIRKGLYQAMVVNIALWGCESWALKEKNRAKLESFHHSCLRKICGWTMWDITEKRITNKDTRRTSGNSPTMEL
jgi:hypothetical protein